MKKNYSLLPLLAALFPLGCEITNAQCPTDLLSGQNLVTNSDFSQGYAGWTHAAAYTEFTSGYSNPGVIYAGSSANYFNPGGFTDYNDHSSSADNMMLMVDGSCNPGDILWQQANIPIKANTTYYFSLWISSLKNNPTYQGHLQFQINGVTLPYSVDAPATGQVWVLAETSWFSGVAPPSSVTITIANTTSSGCATEVDFAIDDISFIPGCSYAAAGPQPSLGPDRTICGTGGITLDANIPHTSTAVVTWSDGTTGTGLAAPYTKYITTGGTYSVCVTDGGSCTKADVIVVSNTYSVNLGADMTLCNPTSALLDAGHSGIGVTYVWEKDGATITGATSKTYLVNSAGNYRVTVSDPTCGVRTDDINITSTAPTPVDAYFCGTQSVTLGALPVNSGKYKWWNSATGTAAANLVQKGGNTYTFTASGTSDIIYYAEDTTSFRNTIGPPLANATNGVFTNPANRGVQNENRLVFDALNAFVLDSVYMYLRVYGCPTNIGLTIVNSGGTTIGTVNWVFNAGNGCTSGDRWVKVPVGISIPAGTGYSMRYAEPSGNNTDMMWFDGGMSYPTTYSSTVRFVSPDPGIIGWKPSSIPGMWQWVVTGGSGCSRIPVRAIYNCVAPVDLLYFTAAPDGNEVSLQWATATETNNDYFTIERSSDGINFVTIATVEAAGNSTSLEEYSYTDHPGTYETLYYRIRQVDFDKQSTLSPVELVSGGRSGISVFPSPSHAGEALNVIVYEATDKLKLSLMDMIGKVVYENSFTLSNGMKTISTGALQVSKGIYFVETITANGNKFTEKVIIE